MSEPAGEESPFAHVLLSVVEAYGYGDAASVAEALAYVEVFETQLGGPPSQADALRRIAQGKVNRELFEGLSTEDAEFVRGILELIEHYERPAEIIAYAYFGEPYDRQRAEELLAEMESQPGSARLAQVLRRISQGRIEADMLTHLSDGDAAVVRDVFETIESLRGLKEGRATDDRSGDGSQ